MENIKKQIYTLPEIRRIIKPLWTGWIVTAIGAVCGFVSAFCENISSDLIYVAIVGAMSLILTLCYYFRGKRCCGLCLSRKLGWSTLVLRRTSCRCI